MKKLSPDEVSKLIDDIAHDLDSIRECEEFHRSVQPSWKDLYEQFTI